ncbi:hypothetical protein SRHO_G00030450 [Serrasalmus rhombeus]
MQILLELPADVMVTWHNLTASLARQFGEWKWPMHIRDKLHQRESQHRTKLGPLIADVESTVGLTYGEFPTVAHDGCVPTGGKANKAPARVATSAWGRIYGGALLLQPPVRSARTGRPRDSTVLLEEEKEEEEQLLCAEEMNDHYAV